jgi:hypothetical protein
VDASEPRNLAPNLPDALSGRARGLARLRGQLERLRCMSALEASRRVLRMARARMERSMKAGEEAAVPAPDLAIGANAWLRVPERVNRAACVQLADRIAEGWLDVLALRDFDYGSPPRWNRDPRTGIEAPLAFGKLLDYRDPDRVGDIRYLWEPNRHRHLVTLAQAWALTRNPKYSSALAYQVESWLLACPYPLGPNWASASEAAVRLINWGAAWQFFVLKEKDLKNKWLKSVYQHAEFIRGWLSLHAGDSRLLAEGAGLFIAGLSWPHWRESRQWLAVGKSILEREAEAQVAPDGVDREQSIAAQQFVLEALLACKLAGSAAGQRFSAAFDARIEAMLDVVASLMDHGGHLPMLGDADDSPLLRFSRDVHPFKSLLATGAILYERGDFKLKAGALDEHTRWLVPRAEERYGRISVEKTFLPPRQQFAHGGVYVLGAEFGTPKEIRLVADAGALGLGAGAARGHADALSFTLSVGGLEFLVDPGTYCYHTHPRWRSYFRGTAAHNTVRVDGADQSRQAGQFFWVRKARAGCSLWLSSARKDVFEGWHDGYMSLEDPVKHRRLIELDKKVRRLVVEDTLEMEEDHEVELFFHCSERCTVEAAQGGFLLSQENVSISLKLPAVNGSTAEISIGSVSPIAGWISRALDVREPAPTIVWRARLPGRAILRTELAVLAPA